MKLPNAERAIIQREKLYDYLLSSAHPVGRFKARFFARLGYKSDVWKQLDADLRGQHLTQNAELLETTRYGQKFGIVAPIKGPSGVPTLVVSIWFIENGGDTPRFITAYPGDAGDL